MPIPSLSAQKNYPVNVIEKKRDASAHFEDTMLDEKD